MLTNEIKRNIDSLRDTLVGKIPDPKAQVEQITIALLYKFMNDMDDVAVDLGGQPGYFVDEYAKYSWRNILSPQNGGAERVSLYMEGLDKMNVNPHLPQLFRDIFRGAYLPYRDPETLNLFLKGINLFSYDHSENLGDAFEYLLSVLGSQGDAGQFRTPRHIIDMMVQIVDPQKNQTVLDPACGTAGFLISAYKHILESNQNSVPGDKLSHDERSRLMKSFTGYDISPDMVRLSRVNMYLHDFPNPQIFEYDTLTLEDRWNDSFDVILANPPFMTPKGGIRPHKKFSVTANRSEVLFVDYIAEHLNPNGKAAVIVPEGIVFQSANAYKALRKYIVENNFLYAVISLPAGVFNPYSGVKTSILLFDKALAKKADSILFVKVENDGFDLGAQRRAIQGSELRWVVDVVKRYHLSLAEDKCFELNEAEAIKALLVRKNDLAGREYVLTGERYREELRISTTWPHVRIADVCTVVSGFGFPNELQGADSDEIPFYKVSDMNLSGNEIYMNKSNNYVSRQTAMSQKWVPLPANTVIFPKIGAAIATNKKRILTRLSLYDNNVMGLICGDQISPRFLFYLLKCYDISRWASDSNPPSIKKSTVEAMHIPLPSLSAQEDIVAEIDSYQRVIDGARQVVENYKSRIKVDPSWPLVELGEVTRIINGRAYSQDELLEEGETPVLRVGNFFSNNNWYYSDLKLDADKYCNKGDLLYAWSASFGPRIWEGPRAIYHYHIWKIETSERVDKEYLYYLLLQETDNIKTQGHGIAMMHITKSGMEALSIPLPDVAIQKAIAAHLNKEKAIVDANVTMITLMGEKIRRLVGDIWGE